MKLQLSNKTYKSIIIILINLYINPCKYQIHILKLKLKETLIFNIDCQGINYYLRNDIFKINSHDSRFEPLNLPS